MARAKIEQHSLYLMGQLVGPTGDAITGNGLYPLPGFALALPELAVGQTADGSSSKNESPLYFSDSSGRLQGWNSKKSLIDVLGQYQEKELAMGYSLFGAQKFDVRFILNGTSLDNQLSRGQQKLFLLALTFAQAKLIERVNRVKPILLIDDVGAELDNNSRTLLNNAIAAIECQVIVTAIDKTAVEQLVPQKENYKMFHVKHGKLSVMSE